MNKILSISLLASACLGQAPRLGAAQFDFGAAIVFPADASGAEQLAAQETRRYLFLRTGHLLPTASAGTPEARRPAVLVARNDQPEIAALLETPELSQAAARLGPEDFWLRTIHANGRDVWLLTGGSDIATLYAAYRFAEHLGVRFYLHGDTLPDAPLAKVPFLDERSSPLFALRGIQPFHDFPEGPDWWNREEYRAIFGQLPKLRMNFFGLHTYPEGGPHAEPTVWIGRDEDFDAATGRVRASYPSSYNNTLRGQAIAYNWGYQPKRTGEYGFGAAQLFERDAFGPDCMRNHFPLPATPAAANEVFDATGEMFRDVFTHVRHLGVKLCAGTETPLTVPKDVQERLRAAGLDPAAPATLQALYEGMFRRIAAAYPLDYYWFWTPEGWTWEGTKDEQIQRTLTDVRAALAAHAAVEPPFQLATCGWVLGPTQDRALFDKVLPKDVAVSCINREVGKTPVDPAFKEVRGRSKWAIPWMEDDPALTSPQLWVGRMRRDAADARRYGCDGLMGIHWRTRVLSPNIGALAAAAWNQDVWNPDPLRAATPARAEGAVGGAVADYPNSPIADTEDDPVYQSVRYNLAGYHFPVPNGAYKVTLKFCEPHYALAGKRVFQVHVQGQRAVERLDIFERVGKDRALDLTFTNVVVRQGWLDLEFLPVVEFPAIAGIVFEGEGVARKINCGGPAWRDFEADRVGAESGSPFAPVEDFYLDWARQHFGPAAGPAIAAILSRVDGRLPRPSDWTDGPGGLRGDPRSWTDVAPEYAFVDELTALRPLVKGAGSRAQFDYWLATFEYHRAMARVNCAFAAFTTELERVRQAGSPEVVKLKAQERLLPLRRDLVAGFAEVYRHLLATVSSPGELGTVMNWEQHIAPAVLGKPGEELAKLLGGSLPADAMPSGQYRGPTRVIVPAVRTSFEPGEALGLRILVLSEQPPRSVEVKWRRLGERRFATFAAEPLGRGVYWARFPAVATANADLEYLVEARAGGGIARFPATAPAVGQTLVRLPTRW